MIKAVNSALISSHEVLQTTESIKIVYIVMSRLYDGWRMKSTFKAGKSFLFVCVLPLSYVRKICKCFAVL